MSIGTNDQAQHGTRGRYQAGCRCPACRGANADYAYGRLPPSDRLPVGQMPGDWVHQGACAGMNPDLFFPSRGEDARQAKAVCRSCPVMLQCREFGRTQSHGIWGGLSEKERRTARRQNRRAS